MALSDWDMNKSALRGVWPKNEQGEFIAPALLTHTAGNELESQLVRSLMESFNIPTVCEYPNDGVVGNIILGHAGGGVDIFVPETMLEDAKNILNADNAEALENE